ncbi:hypothetical protein RvY_03222-2 [Ramazzottius varieornatus]|nr:hypothetical protein RvY_03222-2 [Ramazzottius varieornatus]
MGQISVDTKGCVRFVPYSSLNYSDYISVTPLEDAGTLRYGCWSFPGRVSNQNGRGQFIGVSRGPRGCATNQREIMKVLSHVLGFRMVQNRPDRDKYIKINYENLAAEWRVIDPYRKYLESQVYYRSLPFDYRSITFHPPTKFSRDGMSPVYELLDPSAHIGVQPYLSRWDCVGITTIYGCNPNVCEDPYGDDEIPTRPAFSPPTSSTTPSTTTTTTTTTMTTIKESDTTPSTPNFDLEEDFSTFKPRPTLEPATIPIDFSLPTESTPTAPVFDDPTTTPRPQAQNISIATEVCRPSFRVNAAVYSENGKIYLFSGDYFWTMDFRGEIIDAGISIMERFAGRVRPPIYAAWSAGATTTIVDSSKKSIILRNEQFVRTEPTRFPKLDQLTEAFTFNQSSGITDIYYITNNGTQIQIGRNGKPVSFSAYPSLAGLGDRIDAAFTVPILGSQIIGMFARNDFSYLTPCTLNIDTDSSPCFQSLPVGTWPLPFSSLVSYPAGNCRRRIRLRFPRFRQL